MVDSTITAREQVTSSKSLLCELLRQFYQLGWCTGTGGGISMREGAGYIMAPSGVAKERVQPNELFEMDRDFAITNLDSLENKKVSECEPLFRAIYEKTDAGAVIHSHSVNIVVALSHEREIPGLSWERLEMIKGIRGAVYTDKHVVPVIKNTPRECELTESLTACLEKLPNNAHGIFVRDHGAYIWGRDVMEAKRHAEVYDWLCQYKNATTR
ncbi:MAG: methylthioribulose 1-phosphate dehydratase [Planctomycetota bacterium]|nr:methylthioribulose 1-phosphate dehydratase [Planctomycetota bacterium]